VCTSISVTLSGAVIAEQMGNGQYV
jgi:hypothetical protein